MFPSAHVGGRALLSGLAPEARWGTSGDVLVHLGVRAIPFGIAAMFLTFVLKSAGTQAGPAEIGSPGLGMSVFGTIHPDIFRLRTPPGSWPPADRVQLASLAPQVGFDAAANRYETVTEISASECGNASLDERFAASAKRSASADDCSASFDEGFRSAMPGLASGLSS